ncbi:hypothetical protein UIA24_22910 [Pseudomonas sp. AL 58]|uniref:hypothetical protein n=1 Tax=Pseudomonas sp. AL 58 TaxID=3104275 RepID=UPI002EB9CF8E|nr:hypothetical protein [Pseudomonas sp. AL 58]
MPTENRSSNTEMVSDKLPPCADDVFKNGVSACLVGDVPKHAAETICQSLSAVTGWKIDWHYFGGRTHIKALAPAPQPHPEPIAWMVGTAFWWTKEEAERDAAATGKTITPFGPMIDTGEVERLRAALKFYADREHYHFESGNWDTVSGEPLNILWCGDEPDFIEDGTVARNALSASAEPKCDKCHGRGKLRIATVCGPTDKICPDCTSAEPSAPVERDERAAFEKACREAATARGRELDPEALRRRADGSHVNPLTECGWWGWQARAALERNPS